LGLQLFQSAHTTAWGPLMAASTLFMLPVIVLFALAQKTFISGITLGGLKG
jgi:multiple sugar transport system permease protein